MSPDKSISIRPIEESDRPWVRSEIAAWWGDDLIVLRKTKYYPAEMDGFIAEVNGKKVGLILLRYDDALCEVMSLTALDAYPVVSRKLMNAMLRDARSRGAKKLIVVTTNDNINALRFYQKMGFHLRELRAGILEESRRMKPEIPLFGNYHIPIRDEIELEMTL